MENEIWKDIIIEQNGVLYDYRGLYQVSNMGRVRSLNYRRSGKIEVLKPRKSKNGYLQVMLYKNEDKGNFYIHRLVATAFIPNPNSYTDVDHINRNRQDNRVENLRWLPHENNIPINPNKRKILCIETRAIYNSMAEASKQTGLACGDICRVCNGKRKTCGGYHWKYYTDYLLEINEKNEKLIMELKVA